MRNCLETVKKATWSKLEILRTNTHCFRLFAQSKYLVITVIPLIGSARILPYGTFYFKIFHASVQYPGEMFKSVSAFVSKHTGKTNI